MGPMGMGASREWVQVKKFEMAADFKMAAKIHFTLLKFLQLHFLTKFLFIYFIKPTRY
jgi:hypothetical protein